MISTFLCYYLLTNYYPDRGFTLIFLIFSLIINIICVAAARYMMKLTPNPIKENNTNGKNYNTSIN